MYVQPFEGPLAQTPFAPPAGTGEGGGLPYTQPGALDGLGGDGISRLLPPLPGYGTAQSPPPGTTCGSLAALMQQLVQMLQAMLGYGSPSAFTGGACPQPSGNEQYFSSATAGSNGDPHLSFNGSHWTSVASEPDLLQSDSIPGGFQISTHVTAPDAKGVSWNQSATVSLNGGATTVSLNDAGQPSISSYGQAISVSPGQTVQLGSGQSVTCNQNGSLSISVANAQGGRITTTLAAKNPGVNVDVSAQNVDLGGALVDGNGRSSTPPIAPAPIPPFLPIAGPNQFPTL